MEDLIYKTITRHIIPCWYELGWQENPPALILRIHQDFIKNNTRTFNSELPIVKGLQKEFGFKNFCGDLSKNFGFNDAFIHQKKENDFEEYKIFIPKIKKDLGGKCSYCNGSGKDETFGFPEKCITCSGTGKKFTYDWKNVIAISASLTLIFILLSFPEKETTAKIPQLMTVQTITKKDMHGGSLGGELSLFMRTFLASLWKGKSTPIIEMIQAMKTAYYYMFEPESEDGLTGSYIRAGVFSELGWLNTDCPGDACGLNPENGAEYRMKEGLGYKFDCHNVDTSAQQLTLLAGLAALHDKARREIKSY